MEPALLTSSEEHFKVETNISVDGKCHVLPVSVLSNLKTLVQEKHSQIVKQVIDEDKNGSLLSAESKVKYDLDVVYDDSLEKFVTKIESNNEPVKKKTINNESSSKYFVKKENKKSSSEPQPDVTYSREERFGKKRTDCESSATQLKEKKRPNYFIAVQITDSGIHNVAKQVQTFIQDGYNFSIAPAIVGSEKFHITLMVMHLANEDERKRAVVSLDKCVAPILEKTCGQQVTLQMEGVSAFSGGRVVFARLKHNQGLEHLQFISEEVHRQMGEEGIFSTDKKKKNFAPHMTMVKFAGEKKLLKLGFKRVTAEKYEPFLQQEFGTQSVNSLQLCRMNQKREDGYYFVDHEVFFPLKTE